MSHKASHWLAEVPADRINSGAFRVLFHLCDAHNSKRAPETACFPSQERLREATGLSNGGLNNALNSLERAGLIRRRRTRAADGTKGPTFYILACDEDIAPTPESGDGEKPEEAGESSDAPKPANSTLRGKPSPLSGPNHLHSTGDKPVKEPLKEPRGGTASPKPPSEDEVIRGRAKLILSGKSYLCQSISAFGARQCIDAGLVSVAQCQAVGISV